MDILRLGARQDQVKLLQRLLDKKKSSVPLLREDGIFGPKTQAAVINFQTKNRIGADGAAGPLTWEALGIRYDFTHPVMLYPQPSNVTCWSASATMILGNMSVGPGKAATIRNHGASRASQIYSVPNPHGQ